MQGSKNFEPRLFYQISLEQFVPKDHMVRRLAGLLDFGWVRQATALYYSHTGRPSIDPLVVAKLLLLGYLYNIDSERQMPRWKKAHQNDDNNTIPHSNKLFPFHNIPFHQICHPLI